MYELPVVEECAGQGLIPGEFETEGSYEGIINRAASGRIAEVLEVRFEAEP